MERKKFIRKKIVFVSAQISRSHPRKYALSIGMVAGVERRSRQNFALFPPNAVRGPRFSSRLAPGVKITSTRVYLSGNGGAPGVVLARL